MPFPQHSWEEMASYALNNRLCGLQGQAACFGDEKNIQELSHDLFVACFKALSLQQLSLSMQHYLYLLSFNPNQDLKSFVTVFK